MNKKKAISVYIISVCLLMISVMLLLTFSHYQNNIRNLEYIGVYIDELSNTTSKHVSDVFADKLSSIKSVAYLYGKSISDTNVDIDLLAELEKRSRFDRVRFIAADGTDYTSSGSIANVSDREYFIQRMAGNSGICEVMDVLNDN